MQAVPDKFRTKNGNGVILGSSRNVNGEHFELRQRAAVDPIERQPSAWFEQHDRSTRLDTKLRRELGEQVLALLEDERTEDIVLNPDSSLWVKRMGEGFNWFGYMPPARAASALGTVAAWRGT